MMKIWVSTPISVAILTTVNMEITNMTFISLIIILEAMIYGLYALLKAFYKHDHPNENNYTSSL